MHGQAALALGGAVERKISREVRGVTSAWLVIAVLSLTLIGSAGSLAYSAHVASKLDENANSIASNASPAIGHLTAALGQLLRIQIKANVAVRGTARGLQVAPDSFAASFERLDSELAAYRAIPFYRGEQAQYSEAEAAVVAMKVHVAKLLDRVVAHDPQGAETALIDGLAPALARADESIERLILFNAKQQRELGDEIPRMRNDAARVGYVFQAFTAVFGLLSMALVVTGARQRARLLDERRRVAEGRVIDLSSFGNKLQSILRSTANIASSVTHAERLPSMLRAIAEEAKTVVAADYAAAGCGGDATKPFDLWVRAGASEVEPSDAPPLAVGLLGEVERATSPVRVDDLSEQRTGLPGAEGRLGPFLGVPIEHDGQNVANLYLARKAGSPAFAEDDARAMELLAAHVGIAIDNARLYNEAQAATRAREDLLATVSHDLKSPLNTIRLSAGLLGKTASGPSVDLVARIARSTERMTNLITDLLRAAKIEAGRLVVAAEPADVAQLLHDASEMFTLAAREGEIQFVREADASVVRCERPLLLRVFANLIGNALKFTPPGGSITLGAQRSGENVHFRVQDTGPGIPPALMPHLFDRYWQEKNGDRRGSGLGLFIAKGIVEAHGGRIWVESEAGKGTTMHFTVPAA
jgi:signal transduction histidine kinase